MDMRTLSGKELDSKFASLKKTGQARQELINDLVKVAVYHSVKDGQITPAQKLIGALGRTDAAKEVSHYLQKFGNLGWGTLEKGGKAKGIVFKNKHDRKYTAELTVENLAYANEVFDSLPDLWDAFPNEAVELKDYVLAVAFKRILAEARKRSEAGKKVIAENDEEAKILGMMEALYPAT